jgi:hypothetical protein
MRAESHTIDAGSRDISRRTAGTDPRGHAEVLPTLEGLDRFVPFRHLGKGFSRATIDENTTFDSSDFRNVVSRFTSDNRNANLTLVDWLTMFAERRRHRPSAKCCENISTLRAY